MILDRKIGPEILPVRKFNYVNHEVHELSNQIPIYFYKDASTEVLIFEYQINAGSWFEKKKMDAYFCNLLLKYGTSSNNSITISNWFEVAGATLKMSCQHHTASIQLTCLNRHFEKLLPRIVEVINEASFPQKEFELKKSEHVERLKNKLQQNDFIASKKFSEQLWGNTHPYNNYANLQDYAALDLNSLKLFHQETYKVCKPLLFLFGGILPTHFAALEAHFGSNKFEKTEPLSENHCIVKTNFKTYEPMAQSVQSSIRIGWHSVPPQSDDRPYIQLLSKVFGGYFGSRLMANIREDKGYTYGIHGGYSTHLTQGYFIIATEVGNKVRLNTIKEIYKEIELLKSKKIELSELNLVKNYIAGDYITSFSDLFQIASSISNRINYKIERKTTELNFEKIMNATPEILIEKANLYFNTDEIVEISVG
jgi:zinc protease